MNKLNDIPGNNPFKVPENYFEEVNRKIISVTSGDAEKPVKVSILTRYRPYFAIAASVAGFIIISLFAVILLTVKKDRIRVSDIVPSENMELYINDLDLFTLEENATSVGISEVMSGLESNEIIDFLLEENVDISDIYELL
jgi:hypothetical protein